VSFSERNERLIFEMCDEFPVTLAIEHQLISTL